jgi:hypothetical protein
MYYSVPSYYSENCHTTEASLHYNLGCSSLHHEGSRVLHHEGTVTIYQYFSFLHYILRCSRILHWCSKVLHHRRHPSISSLFTLLPSTTPKLRKYFYAPSYYTTKSAEYNSPNYDFAIFHKAIPHYYSRNFYSRLFIFNGYFHGNWSLGINCWS